MLSPVRIGSVAAALVILVACGPSGSPGSPSAAPGPDDAGPGGITLKAPAPALQAPADGAVLASTSSVTFVVGRVSGLNTTFPITFEFDVARQGGPQIDNSRIAQSSAGSTTFTMTRPLENNTAYTCRVRVIFSGAFGPWSPTHTFRTPVRPAPYVLASEIFDPLTDGRTAGSIVGPVTFLPGVGTQLVSQTSFIRYTLTTPLQAGEISMMATNYDGSSPGDKTKVFSMQEGDTNITDNAYRFTAEMRGAQYVDPGTVAFRIIYGDGVSRDGERAAVSFSRTRWYFWKFTWRTGSATLQVRADGPTGPVVYEQPALPPGGTAPYRPTPHRVYIGSPVGSNGPIDATLPGMIVKDLWVSAQPRPVFPATAAQR